MMKALLAKIWRSKKGLTLLECVVAFTLLTVVAGSILPFLTESVIISREAMDRLGILYIAEQNLATYTSERTVTYTPTKRDGLGNEYLVDVIVPTLPMNPRCTIYIDGDKLEGSDSVESPFSVAIVVVQPAAGNVPRLLYFDISPADAIKLYGTAALN